MSDFRVRLALRCYPRGFRERFGGEIEAALQEQGGGRWREVAELAWTGLRYRAATPGPVIAAAAVLLALLVTRAAAGVVPRIPPAHTRATLYLTMFGAVFFVVLATLFLSVGWLQWSKRKA